jgi:2-polyprenyl-3-methyl-5-hydroxy-6-metoxy-1,4-benzoquinol methylase
LNRLIELWMSSFHSIRSLKKQILGVVYLFSHPYRLKRIIIRETRYGKRLKSRANWLEWQIYDQYIAHLLHSSTEAKVRPIQLARTQTILDMISGIGSGLKVLDVGCGHGIVSEQISKNGNEVACADLPAITSIVHKRKNLIVVASDAETLAFASDSFDVVLASEVLEHLWNPNDFLDEAYRILKANGHLIIEVPEGREGLRWDSHMQFFTLEGLKKLPGTRFTVREIKRLKPVVGVPTPTIIVLLRKSTKETS